MVYDLETMAAASSDDIETVPVKTEKASASKVFRQAKLSRESDFFEVLKTTDRSQIAIMNLQNGQTSGPFGTDHPNSDQTFYVIEGTGQLLLETGDTELHPGDAGIVEAGAKHQFMGKSEHVFKTLNVYSPVAYPDEA